MSVFRLRCGVQHYAWGSPTLMPERFGWEVTGEPFAELWIGDHPSLPSAVLVDDTWLPLPVVLAADPQRWLGAETTRTYGGRLPMLLKILGIGEPLSLQAHPSTTQARIGFAREDALGIDRAAPNRSYRDDRAKPEMICALTAMEALCGFRDLAESRELFGAVGGALGAYVARLHRAEQLPSIVGDLLALRRDDQRDVVSAIAASRSSLPWPVASVVGQLADRYPDDAGVAVALLLNIVSLQPGDALYLPAGNMHAYLSGLGVEVMANSDNVLRGGLTPKHVDVAELVATLNPVTGPWPFTRPEGDSGQADVAFFRSPSPEVGLAQVTVDGADVALPGSDGPTLVVVTEGATVLASNDGSVKLGAGDAAYVLPGSQVSVSGSGVLWASQVSSTKLLA